MDNLKALMKYNKVNREEAEELLKELEREEDEIWNSNKLNGSQKLAQMLMIADEYFTPPEKRQFRITKKGNLRYSKRIHS